MKIRQWITLGILVSSLGSWPQASSGQSAEPTRRARELYDRGRYSDALQVYEEARRKGDDPVCSFGAGTALLRMGKPDQALREFGKALSTPDPVFRSRVRYNMGLAAYDMKDYQQAANLFRACLQENPRQEDARHNLELALLRMARQGNSPDRQKESSQKNQKPPASEKGNEGKSGSPSQGNQNKGSGQDGQKGSGQGQQKGTDQGKSSSQQKEAGKQQKGSGQNQQKASGQQPSSGQSKPGSSQQQAGKAPSSSPGQSQKSAQNADRGKTGGSQSTQGNQGQGRAGQGEQPMAKFGQKPASVSAGAQTGATAKGQPGNQADSAGAWDTRGVGKDPGKMERDRARRLLEALSEQERNELRRLRQMQKRGGAREGRDW